MLMLMLLAFAFLAFFGFLTVNLVISLVYRGSEDISEYVGVDVHFDRPENVTFPAVTICNYNRVQKSKYCKKNPNHCSNDSDNRLIFSPEYKASDFHRFMKHLPPEELKNLRQNWEELVPKCFRTSPNVGERMECKYVYDMLFGTNNQNCFTFLTGEDTLTGDYTKSGFWMTVTFQGDEYMQKMPVGGQIFFHDLHKRIPDDFPHSLYHLVPGMFYTFYLKQTTYERIPYASPDGCRFYETNNGTSSQKECTYTCMFDSFVSSCNCMPNHVPWFYDRTSPEECNKHAHTRECVNREEAKIEEKCKELCPISCTERRYDVKVVAHEDPNYNEEWRTANKDMSNVWIRFETNEIIRYSDGLRPAYFDIYTRIAILYCFVVFVILMLTLKIMFGVCKSSGSVKRVYTTSQATLEFDK